MSGSRRLAALQEPFRRAFAAPASSGGPPTDELLLVRAGGEALAIRVAEAAGLEARRRIVPLPGGPPELLGLAAVRGRLVAVWSLGRLLGLARSGDAREDEGRWLVLAGEELALAFPTFEGTASVARAEIAGAAGGERSHVVGLVKVGTALRGLLRLAGLVDEVGARVGSNGGAIGSATGDA
jgi:chemotaxis signal transduction protein